MAVGELDIRVIYDGPVARVVVRGRLDSDGADAIREAVRPLWNRSGDLIVIDLMQVDAVDIAGLAALLRVDILAREFGSTVKRAAVPVTLERLLLETGLRFRFAGAQVPSGNDDEGS